jgi:glutathionylspermidine synthase
MSLIAPIIKAKENRSLLRYGSKEDELFSKGNESGLGSKGIYYPETVKTRKRKSVNINKSYANKMDFYSKDDGQIKLYEINEDSSAE